MTQPQPAQAPLTYADALALAATLTATVATPAIIAATVNALSDQVAATRDTAVTWATRLILTAWERTDPYDGEQVAEFTRAAGQRMTTAQSTVARESAAAMTQGLAVMGVHTPATASDPRDVRRVDPIDGRIVERPDSTDVDYGDRGVVQVDLLQFATTTGMFNRPAQHYRYEQSQGATADVARQSSRNLIAAMVDENAMLAARLASAEMLQKTVNLDLPGPKIIGYRRIIHPELSRTGVCGLCIAASDRMYFVEELLPIHDRCKCTIAAVTAEHDPGKTINGDDLAALYGLAGGITGTPTTSGPALKRVRYQIDEHGELGPVLVPLGAHKPRTAFTPAQRRAKRRRSTAGR